MKMEINPVKVQKIEGRNAVVDTRDNYFYGFFSEEMAIRLASKANDRINKERSNSRTGKTILD